MRGVRCSNDACPSPSSPGAAGFAGSESAPGILALECCRKPTCVRARGLHVAARAHTVTCACSPSTWCRPAVQGFGHSLFACHAQRVSYLVNLSHVYDSTTVC